MRLCDLCDAPSLEGPIYKGSVLVGGRKTELELCKYCWLRFVTHIKFQEYIDDKTFIRIMELNEVELVMPRR